MAVYIYKAVDSGGKLVKGEMEASGEVELTTQLAKIGYLPVSITFKSKSKTAVARRAGGGIFRGVKRASADSIVIFTRQFSTIIKAAVPILEGLGVLAEQTEDMVLKEALNQVIHDVE